jgi:putative peptidoglycan binding protein
LGGFGEIRIGHGAGRRRDVSRQCLWRVFSPTTNRSLAENDRDTLRVWGGGKAWPASPPVAGAVASNTVSGNPIRELQTDLRDIGYFAPLDGNFDERTEFAVMMFQKHFFSGSRRTLINASDRGKVDRATAEFIKRVRP